MPLHGAHVFASHIGHTGKTTLCFQMSCYFAKRNPDVSVLVMDLAEEGDLTKRLLGGGDDANQTVDNLFGGVFSLVATAEWCRIDKTKGLTSWLWSGNVDLSQHAVKVADHNPAIPENLFLMSSGAWPCTEEEMSEDERKLVCAKIQESVARFFAKSEATWKLFCDTDGDRRPSLFTKIAYGLCPYAIVPLPLSKCDLDRTETMMRQLYQLRSTGEISTRVLLIVWNNIDVIN